MRTTLTMTALAAMTLAALPAAAQSNYYYDRDHHRHYYHGDRGQCRHSNGTTGTIAGAVGGGLIGNAVGGGTLGTLAGAGGGALLGRHLDQKHDEAQNRRNGC